MNRLVIATCAAASLATTGCAHDPQSRGALRGGGIGAAAGAVASLIIPGIGIWGGAALGAIGGAGIGAATAKGKSYHHTQGERYPVDPDASRAEPAASPAPEAPPGG